MFFYFDFGFAFLVKTYTQPDRNLPKASHKPGHKPGQKKLTKNIWPLPGNLNPRFVWKYWPVRSFFLTKFTSMHGNNFRKPRKTRKTCFFLVFFAMKITGDTKNHAKTNKKQQNLTSPGTLGYLKTACSWSFAVDFRFQTSESGSSPILLRKFRVESPKRKC